MSYVFGIDGGGTKTICLLMDENKQVLGRGEAGPSNYQTLGIELTKQSIQLAIEKAILAAKIQVNSNLNIEAICLGLAGVARPKDLEIVQFLVQRLQHRNSGFASCFEVLRWTRGLYHTCRKLSNTFRPKKP